LIARASVPVLSSTNNHIFTALICQGGAEFGKENYCEPGGSRGGRLWSKALRIKMATWRSLEEEELQNETTVSCFRMWYSMSAERAPGHWVKVYYAGMFAAKTLGYETLEAFAIGKQIRKRNERLSSDATTSLDMAFNSLRDRAIATDSSRIGVKIRKFCTFMMHVQVCRRIFTMAFSLFGKEFATTENMCRIFQDCETAEAILFIVNEEWVKGGKQRNMRVRSSTVANTRASVYDVIRNASTAGVAGVENTGEESGSEEGSKEEESEDEEGEGESQDETKKKRKVRVPSKISVSKRRKTCIDQTSMGPAVEKGEEEPVIARLDPSVLYNGKTDQYMVFEKMSPGRTGRSGEDFLPENGKGVKECVLVELGKGQMAYLVADAHSTFHGQVSGMKAANLIKTCELNRISYRKLYNNHSHVSGSGSGMTDFISVLHGATAEYEEIFGGVRIDVKGVVMILLGLKEKGSSSISSSGEDQRGTMHVNCGYGAQAYDHITPAADRDTVLVQPEMINNNEDCAPIYEAVGDVLDCLTDAADTYCQDQGLKPMYDGLRHEKFGKELANKCLARRSRFDAFTVALSVVGTEEEVARSNAGEEAGKDAEYKVKRHTDGPNDYSRGYNYTGVWSAHVLIDGTIYRLVIIAYTRKSVGVFVEKEFGYAGEAERALQKYDKDILRGETYENSIFPVLEKEAGWCGTPNLVRETERETQRALLLLLLRVLMVKMVGRRRISPMGWMLYRRCVPSMLRVLSSCTLPLGTGTLSTRVLFIYFMSWLLNTICVGPGKCSCCTSSCSRIRRSNSTLFAGDGSRRVPPTKTEGMLRCCRPIIWSKGTTMIALVLGCRQLAVVFFQGVLPLQLRGQPGSSWRLLWRGWTKLW
jgi:hypothetical protein